MDALRVLLLSLMVGQSVSANANFAEKDFVQRPPAIVAENPAPTSPLVWDASAQATPSPAAQAAPTRRPSGLSRNLAFGMKGDDVKRVQRLLGDLGYDVAVGGVFSAQTEEAVMLFQHVNGLSVDGIVGEKTYRKLTSRSALGPAGVAIRTVLSYGMKGQDVMELQMRLGQLGYYDDIVSGNYLKNTRKAVRKFQEAHGLFADGIAGPETLYLVFSSMAMPAPGYGGQKPIPTHPGATPSPKPGPTHPGATPSPKPGPGQIVTLAPSLVRSLSIGSSGADVLRLTTRLRELGYYPYEPTSFFDESVHWAVYTFQMYNKLTFDGVAGAETLKRLHAKDAVPFSAKPQATPTPNPSEPAPTPTTAPTSTPVPDCAQCGQPISPGEESRHAPTLAACGIDAHHPCDSLLHEKQPCDRHFLCLPDNLDHQPCPVRRCRRPLCDGHTHP